MEKAVAAYERALKRENPEPHSAPDVVDRSKLPAPSRQGEEAACVGEAR
jgi:hypothetical protein